MNMIFSLVRSFLDQFVSVQAAAQGARAAALGLRRGGTERGAVKELEENLAIAEKVPTYGVKGIKGGRGSEHG